MENCVDYVRKAAQLLTAAAVAVGLSGSALADKGADKTLEEKLYRKLRSGKNFVTGTAGSLEITAYAVPESKLLAYEVTSRDGAVLVLNDYAPFGDLDETMKCRFFIPFTGPIQVPSCEKMPSDLDADEAREEITSYFMDRKNFRPDVLREAYEGLSR